MRADVPVNLADALEVAQVVQAAGRNDGVEQAELLGQPVHLEEVGLMQFDALPVLRGKVSCAIQHRLGAILRNARRVRIPVEDKRARLGSSACCCLTHSSTYVSEAQSWWSRRGLSPLARLP